jgi:hypothetical protein
MAALAYAFPQKEQLLELLGTVHKPDGVTLDSIEFGENSHGEPSIFITYAVNPAPQNDEAQASDLLKLMDESRHAVSVLNLPFFEYIDFRAKAE